MIWQFNLHIVTPKKFLRLSRSWMAINYQCLHVKMLQSSIKMHSSSKTSTKYSRSWAKPLSVQLQWLFRGFKILWMIWSASQPSTPLSIRYIRSPCLQYVTSRGEDWWPDLLHVVYNRHRHKQPNNLKPKTPCSVDSRGSILQAPEGVKKMFEEA